MNDSREIAAPADRANTAMVPRVPRLRGYEIILLATDAAAFAGAMALAVGLYFGRDVPSAIVLGYLTFFPLLLVWRMFCAYAFGLYDLRHRLTAMDHLFGGFGATLAGVLPGYIAMALAQLYGLEDVRVSRAAVALESALLVFWFGLSRALILAWLGKMGWRVRAVLAGPEPACAALAAEMASHGPALFEIAAMLDTTTANGDARLADLLDRQEISQVVLVRVDLNQRELRDLLAVCDRKEADVYIYPDLDAALLMTRTVTSVAGIPLIPLRPAYATRVYRIGKRAVDMTVALGLLVMTAPLLAIAALLVKTTSAGPILYTQDRVGLQGKVFRVFKLRTMRADAEATTGAVLAQDNDPRITSVGKWLRLLRIDEIPQLWNVLRGEMSLVGPRPERPEFTARFRDENPLYERRFLVRPGVTGLAQIHGRYDTDYTHKLRYDLIYIANISMVADLRILAATIQTVLTGKGAA